MFRTREGTKSTRSCPKELLTYLNMIAATLPPVGAKLILRGIHLDLNDATKACIESKAERLFRHEPRIIRLRIDVERAHGGRTWLFTAKGHIEISGPDLKASVTSEDALKSASLLIDKLDRMIRRRSTAINSRLHDGDIRAYNGPGE